MNLIVDIGNTRVKAVIMSGLTIVESFVADSFSREWFDHIVAAHSDVRRAIVSSTRGDGAKCAEVLREIVDYVVCFTPSQTPIPLGNSYHTPKTLGADRLAAAVGAASLYPGADLLVVDFGTAITIDFVEGGSFRGGNISPGVTTRFRSLADYTACLPLCSPTEEVLDYGRTTREAIEQGVMQSITFELEGYIARHRAKNEQLCVIFTGGEAKYFVKRIKNTIFAEPNLVFIGLNRILEYNATKNR